MAFEADRQRRSQENTYDNLAERKDNLVSRLTTWRQDYVRLRTRADAAGQLDLDNLRAQMLAEIRAALGL